MSIIKIAYLVTSCKKVGPIQQTLNIIKNLDKSKFEPILITISPEPDNGTSQLAKFTSICRHLYVPMSKLDIIIGNYKKLKEVLDEICPDVIHSLGVFPDYAICRIKKYSQIITLRNYVWDDYPAKFGKVKGAVLARLQIYAMKNADMTVTCSESLAEIYSKKMSMNYKYVCNGVDIDKYTKASENEKNKLRKKLSLPSNAFIFVYSGQMIERKNQGFLIEAFSDTFNNEDTVLLLLGDGAEREKLAAKYQSVSNIIFKGNVINVNEYLKASDVYVSTSKSEGMPNGVLEAMATGLPVILSDIEQHKEIFDRDNRIGYLYAHDNKEDLSQKMKKIITDNISELSERSYDSAHINFDAKINCQLYEGLYTQLAHSSSSKSRMNK